MPQRVAGVVLAGVEPEGWARQVEAVRRLRARGIAAGATVGLHPWALGTTREAVEVQLRAVARVLEQRDDELVGVGETGLDRLHSAPWPLQVQAFEAQLALARSGGWPVVLHVVRAHADAQAVVRRLGPPAGGLQVHGFMGSAEEARAWVRLGAHLSVGGPATWKRSRKRSAGIRAIPDDRLLVETDAPDQPIAAARLARRPGSPDDLPAVLHAVAELRGQTTAHVQAVTTRNAHALFRLDMHRGHNPSTDAP